MVILSITNFRKNNDEYKIKDMIETIEQFSSITT